MDGSRSMREIEFHKEGEQSICSNNSSACLLCIEKDKIIQNYAKLVDLLKRKLKKCNHRHNPQQKQWLKNSRQLLANTTAGSQQSHNHCQAKDRCNGDESIGKRWRSALNSDSKFGFGEDSSMDSFANHASGKGEMMRIGEEKDMAFEERMVRTFAAGQKFPKHKEQASKKISLSEICINKLQNFSQVLTLKQNRIDLLTDKILTIKNQQMHLRVIILQLLKTFNLKQSASLTIHLNPQAHSIIALILQIFQYSEQERVEIFGGGPQKTEKKNKTPTKMGFERKISVEVWKEVEGAKDKWENEKERGRPRDKEQGQNKENL